MVTALVIRFTTGTLVLMMVIILIRDSLNTFRLAETIYESNPATEKEINITSNGSGTHTFALVNPRIDVVRNSDLKFNLQDPSLFGYQLESLEKRVC